MKGLYDTYRPQGFTNLNTYLFLKDPQGFINFITKVFGAKEKSRTMREDTITNCILQIGDTCLMVAQAGRGFDGMSTCFYLYLNEVDQIHELALGNGCIELYPPGQQDYGDYQSGVQDPFGNYWWITERIVKEEYGSK